MMEQVATPTDEFGKVVDLDGLVATAAGPEPDFAVDGGDLEANIAAVFLPELGDLTGQLVDQLFVGEATCGLTHGFLGGNKFLEQLPGVPGLEAVGQNRPGTGLSRFQRRPRGGPRLVGTLARCIGIVTTCENLGPLGPTLLGELLPPAGHGQESLETPGLDLLEDPSPIVLVGDHARAKSICAKAERSGALTHRSQGSDPALGPLVFAGGRHSIDAVEVALVRDLEQLEAVLDLVEVIDRDPRWGLFARTRQRAAC